MNPPTSTRRKPASGRPAYMQPSALQRVAVLVDACKQESHTKDARSVLLHLARYMDVNGWAYPSPTRLADDSGYSERSVRKALTDLRKTGILLVLEQSRFSAAFDDRTNVPKNLPMILLWPSATRSGRYAALGACDTPPKKLRDTGCPYAESWMGSFIYDGKDWGPYTPKQIDELAQTHSGAPSFLLRGSTQSVDEGKPLRNIFWFASMLPRAPAWARDR